MITEEAKFRKKHNRKNVGKPKTNENKFKEVIKIKNYLVVYFVQESIKIVYVQCKVLQRKRKRERKNYGCA